MLAHKNVFAALIGLVAIIWFLLLSGWLQVTPGSVMVKRQNVLFNSDTSLWLDRLVGGARLPEMIVHPFATLLWRGPCRALYHLLGLFLPFDYAALFAARLLVATIAGIGVGFLALLALRIGIRNTQCVPLFVMYLLFTSSSTVCLPEHFGISNGLLSIAFVAPLLTDSIQIRTIILGAMVFLTGATTVTNAIFPLGSLVHYWFKSMRIKIGLLLAAIPAGLGVALFCYRRSWTIHWFISQYSTFRLLRDPLQALIYAIFALICPAVGPTPRVVRYPGWDNVSYEPGGEPLHLSYYFGFQAIGAIAWIALLIVCVSKGLRDERTRPSVWLLLGWLLFNVVFHNIWGTELFLYAPHWSWALMGLIILGARDLSRTLAAALLVPIVASQIYTLLAIKSALQTIVR